MTAVSRSSSGLQRGTGTTGRRERPPRAARVVSTHRTSAEQPRRASAEAEQQQEHGQQPQAVPARQRPGTPQAQRAVIDADRRQDKAQPDEQDKRQDGAAAEQGDAAGADAERRRHRYWIQGSGRWRSRERPAAATGQRAEQAQRQAPQRVTHAPARSAARCRATARRAARAAAMRTMQASTASDRIELRRAAAEQRRDEFRHGEPPLRANRPATRTPPPGRNRARRSGRDRPDCRTRRAAIPDQPQHGQRVGSAWTPCGGSGELAEPAGRGKPGQLDCRAAAVCGAAGAMLPDRHNSSGRGTAAVQEILEQLEAKREAARLGGGERADRGAARSAASSPRASASSSCSTRARSKRSTCSSSIAAPISAWPSSASPATAWSPARARSTAGWSSSSARTSPSSAARSRRRMPRRSARSWTWRCRSARR